MLGLDCLRLRNMMRSDKLFVNTYIWERREFQEKTHLRIKMVATE